jgi:hypothetical protein
VLLELVRNQREVSLEVRAQARLRTLGEQRDRMAIAARSVLQAALVVRDHAALSMAARFAHHVVTLEIGAIGRPRNPRPHADPTRPAGRPLFAESARQRS